MTNEEYLLRIFPGMKNEWTLDKGETMLAEYFAVQQRQQELRNQWRGFAADKRKEFRMDPEDLLLMQIRLLPAELDPRPLLTREQVAWLTERHNRFALDEEATVGRQEYQTIWELLTTRTVDADRNGLLMKRRFLLARTTAMRAEGPVQRFEVELETGEVRLAEVICTLEIAGRDYVLYFIPNDEGTDVDILASAVVQDAEGYDTLVDIQDKSINQKIREFLEQTVADGSAASH